MKKDNIRFSIVIPVYNTERYVGECLKSIIKQTFKNFEVIIIDDGSVDKSLQICKDMAKYDSRIRIFHNANSGVSFSRNLGIQEAKGEYIIFVDSDDYCDKNMLNTINKYLNEDNLITYGYKKKYVNKEIIYEENEIYTSKKSEIEDRVLTDVNIGGYICNKVFSNKIIKENNIRFDSDIHYSEDLQFTLKYIKNCKGLRNIKFSPYYYRMRKSSVSFNYINSKNATILDLLSRLINEYSDNVIALNKMKYNYLINYYRFRKIYDKTKVRQDIIRNQKKILVDNKLSLKEKIKYYIVYKHIHIYLFVKKIKNKIEKIYI